MTTKSAPIDYALAHGWDDDDLAGLERALTGPTEETLEEALALFGERLVPAKNGHSKSLVKCVS